MNIALEAVDDCATVSLSMIVSLYELQKVMALVVCLNIVKLVVLVHVPCTHTYSYVRSCQFKFLTIRFGYLSYTFVH